LGVSIKEGASEGKKKRAKGGGNDNVYSRKKKGVERRGSNYRFVALGASYFRAIGRSREGRKKKDRNLVGNSEKKRRGVEGE